MRNLKIQRELNFFSVLNNGWPLEKKVQRTGAFSLPPKKKGCERLIKSVIKILGVKCDDTILCK